MFGKALKVDGLVKPISFDESVSIDFHQQSPVIVTCVMDGENVDRVYADEGLTFESPGGLMSYDFKPGAEITFLCSKREWVKKLAHAADETDAMTLHTKGI